MDSHTTAIKENGEHDFDKLSAHLGGTIPKIVPRLIPVKMCSIKMRSLGTPESMSTSFWC